MASSLLHSLLSTGGKKGQHTPQKKKKKSTNNIKRIE